MNKIVELKIEIQRLEAENQIDKVFDLIFNTLDNWALAGEFIDDYGNIEVFMWR